VLRLHVTVDCSFPLKQDDGAYFFTFSERNISGFRRERPPPPTTILLLWLGHIHTYGRYGCCGWCFRIYPYLSTLNISVRNSSYRNRDRVYRIRSDKASTAIVLNNSKLWLRIAVRIDPYRLRNRTYLKVLVRIRQYPIRISPYLSIAIRVSAVLCFLYNPYLSVSIHLLSVFIRNTQYDTDGYKSTDIYIHRV
jgi:hypothetical protein